MFDLGCGSLVSIRSIVEEIGGIIGNGVEPDFGALPHRPFEHERAADMEFIERVLHWRPVTSLHNGLQKTVTWFKSSLAIAR